MHVHDSMNNVHTRLNSGAECELGQDHQEGGALGHKRCSTRESIGLDHPSTRI